MYAVFFVRRKKLDSARLKLHALSARGEQARDRGSETGFREVLELERHTPMK